MLLSFASDKSDVIYKHIYIVEDCYIERVILIINMLTKLLKLEHHRNVYESCNVINVIPNGLRIKESSSCVGEQSLEIAGS